MKHYWRLYIFLANIFFITGCGVLVLKTETDETDNFAKIDYQILLDKSLRDDEVVNFISHNNCSSAGEFWLCRESGMALWVDSMQVVKMVWLYSWNADGFNRYRGELPYGLTFYDPMWLVMEKMTALDEENSSIQASLNGLPDVGSSPDHIYYWAEYKRFNMIVIYDSPFADEDAYIYAILVNADSFSG